MPDVKQLRVRTGVDLKGLDRGLVEFNSRVEKAVTQARRDYGRLADAGKRIGTGLTIGATAPIVLMGTAAIRAAMDATESENKFEVAFKGMSESARRWSKEFADSIGLNDYALRSMASQFQLLFNAMGKGDEEGAKMSTTLTQLSYDLASLYNTSIEEAFVRLQSGLVGETEAVRRFGIDVSEASLKQEALRLGLGKNIESMSQSEKVMLRYRMIMAQTTDAQGDLKRTADSAANQTRIMKEQSELLAITFGNDLIPAYKDVVGEGIKLIRVFNDLSPGTRRFIIDSAGVVAVTGPLVGTISAAWQAWLNYAQYTKLATIATNTARKAQELETISGGANTAAKAANATVTTTALIPATTGATTAIVAQTAAVNANTAAWAARWIAVAGPVAAAAVVVLGSVAAAIEVSKRNADRDIDEAYNNIKKGTLSFNREMENYQRTYSRHSIEQLERDLARQKELRAQANKELKYVQGASYGRAWEPMMRQRERDAQYQYDVANQRVIWLKKELAKRQEAAVEQARITEEQAKELAENEKANTAARREQWILKQKTEIEQEKARAWVEYTKAKEDILEHQKKVQDKLGITLDVADQLAGAAAEYRAKLADINTKEQEALGEQKMAEWTAAAHVVSLGLQNDFARRWLDAEIQYNQTMADLAKEKAKGYDITNRIKEAEARKNQAQDQIAKESRMDQIRDLIGKEQGRAIETGDEYEIKRTNILARYWEYIYNPDNWKPGMEGRRALVIAQTKKELDDLAKEQAEAVRQKTEEHRKELVDLGSEARESWTSAMTALAQGTETYYSGRGDKQTGALASLEIGFKAQMQSLEWQREELRRKMSETAALRAAVKTDDERETVRLREEAEKQAGALLDARRYEIVQERSKKYIDTLTGGIDQFYNRAKQRKDEELKAWEDRTRAAREYYDYLRSQTGLSTLEETYRNVMAEGAASAVPAPYIPPQPSLELTQADLQAAFDQMIEEQRQTRDQMARVADVLDQALTRSYN